MKAARYLMPHAREAGLVVKVLPDEVLVYDVERHQVHCLNWAAAHIWEHCDGRTTVAEVAALLRDELQGAAGEEVIWLTLDDLRRARLLRADEGRKPESAGRVSRRTLIRRLGVAAALLPLVASVVVPEAAAAQSIRCGSFTTKEACQVPTKVCNAALKFSCKWSGGQNLCLCK